MQFFILFVGAMVFLCSTSFTASLCLLFQKAAMTTLASQPAYSQIQTDFDRAWTNRENAAQRLNAARKASDKAALAAAVADYRTAQYDADAARGAGIRLYQKTEGQSAFSDTNYIFLSFVTKYFPVGFVGLVIAVIFTAAMSSSSGELNSLAAVSVMDIYRRHFKPHASDRHYLVASRIFTAVWGAWAVVFAQFARHLGSLVEAVNQVGSFFYPVL